MSACALAGGCATPSVGHLGSSQSYQKVFYDEKGRMTERREFKADGGIKSSTTYQYQPDGSLFQKTIEPRSDHSRTEITIYYPSQRREAFKTVRVYDSQGQILSEKQYSSSATAFPTGFRVDKSGSVENK